MSETFVKILGCRDVCELLTLNSLNHPNIIKVVGCDFDESGAISMSMPEGKVVSTLSDDQIIQVILTLYELEKCGIVYGDLKIENMVVQKRLCLIDFGLVNFTHHLSHLPSQTFDSGLGVSPIVNLIWAIGVMIFRNLVVDIDISSDRVTYDRFVGSCPDIVKSNQVILGKWYPLVERCLNRSDHSGCNTIGDLLKFLPPSNIISTPVKMTLVKFPKVEEYPPTIPFEIFLYMQLYYPGETIIRTLRFFKGASCFVNNLEDHVLLGVSCIIITISLFGYNPSIQSLSHEWNVSPKEIFRGLKFIVSKLNYCLPEILIAPLEDFTNIYCESLIEAVTHPKNYSLVHSHLKKSNFSFDENGQYNVSRQLLDPQLVYFIDDNWSEDFPIRLS